MKTLRIEVSYFVVDEATNNRTSEGIRFYRNKNKTPLSAPLDRHRRVQYDKALELIVNKDYATILELVQRDLKEQYDQIEVIDKSTAY